MRQVEQVLFFYSVRLEIIQQCNNNKNISNSCVAMKQMILPIMSAADVDGLEK